MFHVSLVMLISMMKSMVFIMPSTKERGRELAPFVYILSIQIYRDEKVSVGASMQHDDNSLVAPVILVVW